MMRDYRSIQIKLYRFGILISLVMLVSGLSLALYLNSGEASKIFNVSSVRDLGISGSLMIAGLIVLLTLPLLSLIVLAIESIISRDRNSFILYIILAVLMILVIAGI
ncbi:MAG: hypothetical protein QXJ51_02485 [Sulfolobales archaeon]